MAIRLEIHGQEPVAVPLPVNAREWMPNEVLLDDGGGAPLLRAPDGGLWVRLGAGRHDVLVARPPAARPPQPALALASPSRRGQGRGLGRRGGIREDGVPESQIQLTRQGKALRFDALQVALVLLTVLALGALFAAIHHGLLGAPEMQIAGNGSTASRLAWYQDQSDALLPRAYVISVPLWVYRFAMLAWALWLAFALLRWLRWGFESFSAGGLWKPRKPASAGPPIIVAEARDTVTPAP